jgi:hypothetical protein
MPVGLNGSAMLELERRRRSSSVSLDGTKHPLLRHASSGAAASDAPDGCLDVHVLTAPLGAETRPEGAFTRPLGASACNDGTPSCSASQLETGEAELAPAGCMRIAPCRPAPQSTPAPPLGPEEVWRRSSASVAPLDASKRKHEVTQAASAQSDRRWIARVGCGSSFRQMSRGVDASSYTQSMEWPAATASEFTRGLALAWKLVARDACSVAASCSRSNASARTTPAHRWITSPTSAST